MKKFGIYYLYLIAGIVWLIALIITIVKKYPDLPYTGIFANSLFAILMFYLAYKTYHEKKDRELM